MEKSKYHRNNYGEWAGNPRGIPVDTQKCAYEVWSMHRFFQCSRKRGHGPEQAFCKQHAKRYESKP